VIAARYLAIVAAACLMLSANARTQWLEYPSAGIPRLPDGKPNLTAPVPRTADGTPDLSEIWEVVGDRVMETDGRVRSKYVYNIAVDLPGGAPFLPWAKAVYDERQKALGVGAPSERCLPHGIPDAMLTRTLPFKIFQMRSVTVILYEEFNNWRQIFTDGRPLPKDPQPAWLGYSVGSWDGETFIVETTGFNDKSWLDAGGHTPYRGAQNNRATAPTRLRSHGDHLHVRRPKDVHDALVGHREVQFARRHRTARAPLREREVGRQDAALTCGRRRNGPTVPKPPSRGALRRPGPQCVNCESNPRLLVCRRMYACTNGHTATTRRPSCWAVSIAHLASALAMPRPRSAAGTSVSTSTTACG
jgi:hypothetical protein